MSQIYDAPVMTRKIEGILEIESRYEASGPSGRREEVPPPSAPVPDKVVDKYLADEHSLCIESIDRMFEWYKDQQHRLTPHWSIATDDLLSNTRNLFLGQWLFQPNQSCYLVFWGPVTCLLFAHLLNNSPSQTKHSVSVSNCLGILLGWIFLLSFFLFVFTKSTSDRSITFSSHLCFLSFQYVLVLPFFVGYSVLVTVPVLKYLVVVGYVGGVCWTGFRCYYHELRPDLLQMGVLSMVIVVMDFGQAVMLAQEIDRGVVRVGQEAGVVAHMLGVGHKWVHLN